MGERILLFAFNDDLPPVLVPVFKPELNPIPNCIASTEAVADQEPRLLRLNS